MDAAGNLFIADTGNERVRKVTPESSADAFFPQVAVGDGYSTTFILENTGSTTISGTLKLTDQQGNPFVVSSPNLVSGSSFAVLIPSGGTTFLTVNALNVTDPHKAAGRQSRHRVDCQAESRRSSLRHKRFYRPRPVSFKHSQPNSQRYRWITTIVRTASLAMRWQTQAIKTWLSN